MCPGALPARGPRSDAQGLAEPGALREAPQTGSRPPRKRREIRAAIRQPRGGIGVVGNPSHLVAARGPAAATLDALRPWRDVRDGGARGGPRAAPAAGAGGARRDARRAGGRRKRVGARPGRGRGGRRASVAALRAALDRGGTDAADAPPPRHERADLASRPRAGASARRARGDVASRCWPTRSRTGTSSRTRRSPPRAARQPRRARAGCSATRTALHPHVLKNPRASRSRRWRRSRRTRRWPSPCQAHRRLSRVDGRSTMVAEAIVRNRRCRPSRALKAVAAVLMVSRSADGEGRRGAAARGGRRAQARDALIRALLSWPWPDPANPYVSASPKALARRRRATRLLASSLRAPARCAVAPRPLARKWMVASPLRLRYRARGRWVLAARRGARAGVSVAWTAHNLRAHRRPAPRPRRGHAAGAAGAVFGGVRAPSRRRRATCGR